MSMSALVLVAGFFNLAFAIFHLYFWRLFDWAAELSRVSAVNRGIVQVLNLCLTYLFVAFAALCLLFPMELLGSELGQFVLFVITAFWAFRLILQPLFFGLRHRASWAISVVFFLGVILHGYAWWTARSIQ